MSGMNSLLIYNTIEQEQLERLIDRKTAYLRRLPQDSRQAPYLASEVQTLRGVLLALQASQNVVMTDLVRGITGRLAELSRIPGAESLNGLMYYYRLREPDEERRNVIALTGDAPRDEVRIKDITLFDGYEECETTIIKI